MVRMEYHLLATYLIFNSYPDEILYECMAVNLIDLDHLLADPIYDKTRNSFETHPLHEYWYVVLFLSTFILSEQGILSLMLHYFMDYIDPDVIH